MIYKTIKELGNRIKGIVKGRLGRGYSLLKLLYNKEYLHIKITIYLNEIQARNKEDIMEVIERIKMTKDKRKVGNFYKLKVKQN